MADSTISGKEQENNVFTIKLPRNITECCVLASVYDVMCISSTKVKVSYFFAMYYNFSEFSLFGDKKLTLTRNKDKKNEPETLKFDLKMFRTNLYLKHIQI